MTPSSTRSIIPPLAAATTGRPTAIASRTTVGQQSCTIEGTATTEAVRMRSMTDGWSSNPRSTTSPERSSGVSSSTRPASTEAGTAAKLSVCLEQHVYPLVPTQYSGKDDGSIWIRDGLVHHKVVGNKIWDDHIGTPSR